MKLSELKTGMILKFFDGNTVMVLKGTDRGDIYAGRDAWAPISSNIYEDLSGIYPNTEVIKVYQPRSNSVFLSKLPAKGVDFDGNSSYTVIFDREEKETPLQREFNQLQSQIKELQEKANSIQQQIK